MNILECFSVSISSILSNKLRSFLTMLGIIIGIASVIAIVAIGVGGKGFISGQFDKIGVNVVEVTIGDKDVTAKDFFTLNDVKNIKSKVMNVKAAATMVNKMGRVKYDKINREAMITGTTDDYSAIFNVEMLYGRYINEKDVLMGKNIAVIDDLTARKLFGYEDCTGKTIKLGSKLSQTSVIVTGVMRSQGAILSGIAGDSLPSFIHVPVTFLKKMFPDDFVISQIDIGVTDYNNADTTAGNAVKLLEKTHRNSGKYIAQNLMKQLDRVNAILDKFTLIISAIAAISLIVGGIGVMNIMLVSVSERTREIGIRKALGAARINILLQFLTEAIIISMIGGAIGLVIGFSGGYILGTAMGLVPVIPVWVVFLVFGLTTLVGIFFGIYPANKASILDPIEALRYE